MEIPVKLNGEQKTATVVFITKPDFAFIEQWRSTLEPVPHPHRRDSVEFADLTRYKFTANRSKQAYAGSLIEFQDHITDNPNVEVACLVYLKCDWFPHCQIIGLGHFRRTWTNRIVLDYLCMHPLVSRADDDAPHKVKGAGGALLYFVAKVAKHYNCDMLWGEATPNSCGFYKKVLELDEVRDLIVAPEAKYLAYCDRIEKAWAEPAPNVVLEELYKAEEEHPPFVGSKTTVYSASQILVVHFLELSLNLQQEVAEAVDFTPTNLAETSDEELFQQILQHAQTNNLMAVLWPAVESRHPSGTPTPNPFTI